MHWKQASKRAKNIHLKLSVNDDTRVE